MNTEIENRVLRNPPTHQELENAIESIDDHTYDVANIMAKIIEDLEQRAARHDMSKYDEEELNYIAKMMAIVEKEGKVAYGTPEYHRRTEMIKPDGLVHLGYAFEKYQIPPQLQSIIVNTLDALKIGYTVLPNTEE